MTPPVLTAFTGYAAVPQQQWVPEQQYQQYQQQQQSPFPYRQQQQQQNRY